MTAINPAPPPQTIREWIRYDPEDGRLYWTNTNGNRSAGSVAGTKRHKDGYITVGFRGRCYSAHRLAWWLVTGEWPAQEIDHKNRKRDDNRWTNLRLATRSQNALNTSYQGKHGRGVTLHKTGRYQAQIVHEGRCRYLGLFETKNEALAAYQKHKRQLRSGCEFSI